MGPLRIATRLRWRRLSLCMRCAWMWPGLAICTNTSFWVVGGTRFCLFRTFAVRAFARTPSEIKVTATLDIVMPFCVSGDSHWQLACCYGGAWEWLRRVFDRMVWSLVVSTAWMPDPSGGKLCWRSCSSQGVDETSHHDDLVVVCFASWSAGCATQLACLGAFMLCQKDGHNEVVRALKPSAT